MRYLAADVGGTFTDLVLVDFATGTVHLDKLPSTPGSAASIVEGIRRITQHAGCSAGDIDLFVHGFTVATNAFLMRTGAETVLVTTDGFTDVLEIGTQLRPHLYALAQTKPAPVIPRSKTVAAKERIDAFGAIVEALTAEEAKRVASAVAALEPRSVAVCLAFSYRNTAHEERLAEALRQHLPNVPVYLSSRVNPQIEEYPRANTTAIAAYVGPVVDAYLSDLERELETAGLGGPLRVMRSDGGIATPRAARENPAHMMFSGPAGGVMAGAAIAKEIGEPDMVTFDMGGTTADFSLIVNGEPRVIGKRNVCGQPLRLSTLDIESISAGGGSIAWVDIGGSLKIGPKSAGAVPGPACYGKGGTQPTVTDAAVVLGLLAPEAHLGGEMVLDVDRAKSAIEQAVAFRLTISVEEAAFGIIAVANAQMIQGIRSLSIERGYDVRNFSLLAFGGAGPLYAGFLAEELGMRSVIVPQAPGVLAAAGLLMCDIRHSIQRSFPAALVSLDPSELRRALLSLEEELARELEQDGIASVDRRYRYDADLRYIGQHHEIPLSLPEPNDGDWWQPDAVSRDFHAAHDRLYGHADPAAPIEFVNLRVHGIGKVPRAQWRPSAPSPRPLMPASERIALLDKESGFSPCPVYRREDLGTGYNIAGPALIDQRDTTTVVLKGQRAFVTETGILRIELRGR